MYSCVHPLVCFQHAWCVCSSDQTSVHVYSTYAWVHIHGHVHTNTHTYGVPCVSMCAGKELVCKPEVQPSDLKLLCHQLRASLPNERRKLQKQARNDDKTKTSISSSIQSTCKGEGTASLSPKAASLPGRHEGDMEPVSEAPNSLLNAPTSLYDLLHSLLRLDPGQRITADEALRHPFITDQ